MTSGPGTIARPIRLGVLGCASVAWRRTLPSAAGVPGLRVAAIASRHAAKAKAFAERFGGDPVSDYDSLFARDDLDAIYVPLPAALHPPWVERALLAGLHVLVEKPLACGEADARRLAALARERRLVLMENFAFVQHSQHAAARALLDAGEIGELRGFASEFAFPPLDAGDIRYVPELGGGALLDAGVYPIRAAALFLGTDLDVVGAALRIDPHHGVDVAGSALLASSTGVTAQLSFGFIHDYRCSVTLWGSAGRITLDRAYTAPDDCRPVLRLERGNHREDRVLPPDPQFAKQLAAFCAAVRDADVEAPARAVVAQARLVGLVSAAARRYQHRPR